MASDKIENYLGILLSGLSPLVRRIGDAAIMITKI